MSEDKEPQAAPDQGGESSKKSQRILVVDDNEMNRDMLARRLERKGYRIDVADGGKLALDLVEKNSYDLILLDIRMPDIDGYEALARIRVKHSLMDLPVIMVTAKDSGEEIVNALKKGANDYLTKPIDFPVALARVTTQLQIKKLQDELTKARDLAIKASGAKTDFLASMSHEIRTPMNAIIGMAELLAETELDKEQKEYVSTLMSAGEALLAVINDILDLSKIEAGQMSIESIPFDLRELIVNTEKIMKIRTDEKGLALSSVMGADVPTMLIGDPNRLRQIIINLIGNAVKFTSKGSISLKVEKDRENDKPGALRFSVTDTGIGIPADRLDAIFDKFSQADYSITRKYGGTGLGLSICKNLTRLMGGRIWVESEPDKGSAFIFTAVFDVAQASSGASETTAAVPAPTQPTSGQEGKPMRILLVEDTPQNRMLIKAYLAKAPYAIVEAENGAIAVEKFKSEAFDVVLMDMQMPVMDGITATREIRKWERESGKSPTPIIALTANALLEHSLESTEAGCDEHLTKPVKKDILIGALNKYAGKLS